MKKIFMLGILFLGIYKDMTARINATNALKPFSFMSNSLINTVKSRPYLTATALIATAGIATPTYYYRNHQKEERWVWESIDTKNIVFPQGFLWGDSISAFQYEGTQMDDDQECQNSWTEWEKEEVYEKTNLFSFKGIAQAFGLIATEKHPRTPFEKRAGHACKGWELYETDAKLLAECGIKGHRFSIEWAKVEPENGKFNQQAIDHYIAQTRAYLDHGIVPIINFWHHTLPVWIYNNNHKVGFEDPETKQRFVTYVLHVLQAFKEAGLLEQVKLFLTFNEPIGYALAAYVDGKLPPGKKFNFKQAGIVAKNMLDAHIEIYDAAKKIDDSLKFSIAHVMTPVQPYNPQNPMQQWLTSTFDYLINDVVLDYFKTGNFNWMYLVRDNNPNAIGKLDFLGVNYYTGILLGTTGPAVRPEDECADGYENPKKNRSKALYAEGLYLTLKKAATLGVPILITENGCAAKDESIELRKKYFEQHLYVIHKAMQEGIDIRGYLMWTGIDCFGWDSGQHSNHGIYKVDFETQERTLKQNAQYLIDIMKNSTSETEVIEPLCPLRN